MQKIILEKQQQTTEETRQYFKRFKDLQFWHWNIEEHKAQHAKTKGECCFNHLIGLPRKNDVPMPLFDYQRALLDTLEEHGSKFILVRKSTGLGLTTLFLRWMSWLCLRNDDMNGKEMAVVVGPNQLLAIGLIEKIKAMFVPHGITFDSKATSVTLGECQINAYPSNHLDAMRSRMDLKVILVDELEFFEPGERAILRDVVERYIAKSDPYILMVSTPAGSPNSLMQRMEQEEPSIYRKFVMDWTVGIDKIYSRQEIALARQSPSFAREYECQYGAFEGNVFSLESIQRAIDAGRRYDPERDYIPNSRHVIGVDPGYSSSKFAITVLQLSNGRAQVLYCQDWENVDMNQMVHHVIALMKRYYHVNAIFVDGSNVPYVRALKQLLHERPDYEQHIKEIRQSYPHTNIHRFMKVLPVNFATEHKTMLSNVKSLLDDSRNLIQIHPSFTKLIDSLKSATAKEYSLQKESTINDDIFDSFRLAMRYVIYEPEEGASR